MNEWVPVKGWMYIEDMNRWTCEVNTTSVDTLDRLRLYCYTGYMLGKAPRTKETLSDFFVEIWIPINGTQPCSIG